MSYMEHVVLSVLAGLFVDAAAQESSDADNEAVLDLRTWWSSNVGRELRDAQVAVNEALFIRSWK